MNTGIRITSLVVRSVVALLVMAGGAASQQGAEPQAPKKTIKLLALASTFAEAEPLGLAIKNGVQFAAESFQGSDFEVDPVFIETPPFFRTSEERTAFFKAVFDRVGPNDVAGIAANLWGHHLSDLLAQRGDRVIPIFQSYLPLASAIDPGKLVFSTEVAVEDRAAWLAEEAIKRPGVKSVCLVRNESDTGKAFEKAFEQAAKKLGGSADCRHVVDLRQTSFDLVLDKLEAVKERPFVIVSALFGRQSGWFLSELHSSTVDAPVLSLFTVEIPANLDPAVIEDAEFLAAAAPETPKAKEFGVQYRQKFGRAPTVLSRTAHDSALILARALADCGAKAECLRKQISSTQDLDGASGRFSINDRGTAKTTLRIRQGRDIRRER